MIICRSISQLDENLSSPRKNRSKVVFVPTMGALHHGHLSLLEKARECGDLVVCCIFVNPTQFNEKSDLDKYPRPIENDIELLESVQCDILFLPEVKEIYPEDYTMISDVDFGFLTSILEAEKRPGHFDGVINVVKRLFEIVQPDKSCFGLKDFQQISIVKRMVKEFDLGVEIIGCPIIREESGLAMSSRNMRLTTQGKIIAENISRTLKEMNKQFTGENHQEVLSWGSDELGFIEGLKLEYLEMLNPEDFSKISAENKTNQPVVLAAAWVDGIRLIDNMILAP